MRAQCLVFRTLHLNTLSKLYVPNYSCFAWLQDLLTQPQKRHNNKPSAYFQNTDILDREWAWQEGFHARRGGIHLLFRLLYRTPKPGAHGSSGMSCLCDLGNPGLSALRSTFPFLLPFFPPKTDSRWLTWICQGGLSVCAISHRAGTGEPSGLDTCTNTAWVHFRSSVVQIKYPMKCLGKEGKKEHSVQVAFRKNSRQNPSWNVQLHLWL